MTTSTVLTASGGVTPPVTLGARAHLTFQGNVGQARYGWLRLTPAYSVHLVEALLNRHTAPGSVVLDPFCGSGTTALACALRGVACDTTDINPFLLWLAAAKARTYTAPELDRLGVASDAVLAALGETAAPPAWVPPLHSIERWWDAPTLQALGRAAAAIGAAQPHESAGVADLLKVIFCRTLMDHANVSFGHQSLSFKPRAAAAVPLVMAAAVAASWRHHAMEIAVAAAAPVGGVPRHMYGDARDLRAVLPAAHYDCVITSPPYPNRMSYIRELRPYMYWLGYLADGRAAGELDWQAIGGTWGCATSKVGKWRPPLGAVVPSAGFAATLAAIARRSPLLANYVDKYFHDMRTHCAGLFAVVKPGGTIHYIVGNSKFYDTLLPVEATFADLFRDAGFVDLDVAVLRKRSSKKELFEYLVSARRPADATAGL